MIRLHHDPHYTFRFADARVIPRFHLEGLGAGRAVGVSASTQPPACGSAC